MTEDQLRCEQDALLKEQGALKMRLRDLRLESRTVRYRLSQFSQKQKSLADKAQTRTGGEEREARTLRAAGALQAAVKSAKVQKLAATTNLRDLNDSLLAWLGSDREAEGRKGLIGRYKLVGDLSHDVWVCTIGDATAYGRTFADAVLATSEKLNITPPAPDR